MTYRILFQDKSIWQGGDLEDTKWNEMPKKNIQSICIGFSKKHIYMFEGFEQYCLIRDYTQIIGKGSYLARVILMGVKEDKTHQVVLDLEKQSLYKNTVEPGKELRDRPVSGWKPGLLGVKASIKPLR